MHSSSVRAKLKGLLKSIARQIRAVRDSKGVNMAYLRTESMALRCGYGEHTCTRSQCWERPGSKSDRAALRLCEYVHRHYCTKRTQMKQGRAQLSDRRRRVLLETFPSRVFQVPRHGTAQRNSDAPAFDVFSLTCPLFTFWCFGFQPTWPRMAPRPIVFTCTVRLRPFPSGSSTGCGCSTVGGENRAEYSSNVPSNAACASKITGAFDDTADAFRSEFAGASVTVTRATALVVRVLTRNAPSTE